MKTPKVRCSEKKTRTITRKYIAPDRSHPTPITPKQNFKHTPFRLEDPVEKDYGDPDYSDVYRFIDDRQRELAEADSGATEDDYCSGSIDMTADFGEDFE